MTLRKGRHVVKVQLYTATTGSLGQDEVAPSGDPVPVRGNWHDGDTSEREQFGAIDTADARFHIFPPTVWPGDARSRVIFDGDEYDVIGIPRVYRMSAGTAHTEIRLRRRKVAPNG